jgi:hypothetical protein
MKRTLDIQYTYDAPILTRQGFRWHAIVTLRLVNWSKYMNFTPTLLRRKAHLHLFATFINRFPLHVSENMHLKSSVTQAVKYIEGDTNYKR